MEDELIDSTDDIFHGAGHLHTNGHVQDDGVVHTKEKPFLKKYLTLRKQCENIQHENERLVNRIQRVKRITKRFKLERRFLITKLEGLNDNIYELKVPHIWEQEIQYETSPLSGEHRDHNVNMSAVYNSPSTTSASLSTPENLTNSTARSRKKKVGKTSPPLKQPANAFLLFCQRHKKEIHAEYRKEFGKDIPKYELTKRLALKWNSLANSDRAIYFQMYEFEKEHLSQEVNIHSRKTTVLNKPSPQISSDLTRYDEQKADQQMFDL